MPQDDGKDGGVREGAGVAGTDSALVERERELDVIAELLASSERGDGRLGLIEGPAGIGKSRLLSAARDRADDDGMTSLTARGGELETEFPFGVVRQLLEPALTEPARRERALQGSAAQAATVFGPPDAASGDGGESTFATLHGLYWLTVNLATERPLFLAIDDLHWCDRPSLRFVAFLVRRLEGLSIVIGAGLRSTEPGTDAALLAEITQDPATVHLRLGPLSAVAVADLIALRLGGAIAPEFSAACFEATGGNPLLLGQLLTALETEGISPGAESVGVVRAIGPRAVSRSVLLRLRRLEGTAIAVAQALAVLGDGANLRAVAALAEVGTEEAAAATGQLARAEILRPEPPLGFVHPLVKDAIYAELPPGERELRHARAAETQHETGASEDQIAAQLLLAPPSDQAWVARLLQEAGRAATRRGAADSAVSLFRRAWQEPPPAEHRAQVLLELGLAESLVNGPSAVEHLRQAYEGLTDPASLGLTANVLGRLLLFTERPEDAAAFAARARVELPEELTDLRDSLEALELACSFFDVGDRERAWSRLEALRAAGPPERLGEKMLAAVTAMDWNFRGGPAAECAELGLAALEGGDLIAADNGLLSVCAIHALSSADHEATLEHLEAATADAHSRGSLFSIASVHLWSSFVRYRRGELVEAEDQARTFLDDLKLYGFADFLAVYGGAFLALTLVERGDIPAARTALEVEQPPDGLASDGSRYWRAAELEVLIAEGRDEDVLVRADQFRELYPWLGTPILGRWRAAKAKALERMGMHDAAIELLTEELAVSRRMGAPSVIGTSLILLAEIDRDNARALLAEALEVLELSPAQLERAKALCALGTALRLEREPTEAREPLRQALEIATACGADGLAERARSELHASGARPRREALSGAGSLTPSERRVAALAAEGRTNREIAQELYVTPKTVEVHLSNTYRKLDISGRRQLAGALET